MKIIRVQQAIESNNEFSANSTLAFNQIFVSFAGQMMIYREVQVMTIDTLISNIGGILELFVGLSLFSFFHLILFFGRWASSQFAFKVSKAKTPAEKLPV